MLEPAAPSPLKMESGSKGGWRESQISSPSRFFLTFSVICIFYLRFCLTCCLDTVCFYVYEYKLVYPIPHFLLLAFPDSWVLLPYPLSLKVCQITELYHTSTQSLILSLCKCPPDLPATLRHVFDLTSSCCLSFTQFQPHWPVCCSSITPA